MVRKAELSDEDRQEAQRRAGALYAQLGSYAAVAHSVTVEMGERVSPEAIRKAHVEGKVGISVARGLAALDMKSKELGGFDQVDSAGPRDRQEVEHVPPATMGRGRWKYLAARYWTFRRQADIAQEAGAPEAALDLAADELGEHKGEGPTEEQAATAIDRAVADLERGRTRFGPKLPAGREATADDFKPTAPPAKRGARR